MERDRRDSLKLNIRSVIVTEARVLPYRMRYNCGFFSIGRVEQSDTFSRDPIPDTLHQLPKSESKLVFD